MLAKRNALCGLRFLGFGGSQWRPSYNRKPPSTAYTSRLSIAAVDRLLPKLFVANCGSPGALKCVVSI